MYSRQTEVLTSNVHIIRDLEFMDWAKETCSRGQDMVKNRGKASGKGLGSNNGGGNYDEVFNL